MGQNKVRLLHLMKSCEIGGVEKSTIIYSNYLVDTLNFVGIYASKGIFDTTILNKKVKRFSPIKNIWEKKYFVPNLVHLLKVIKSNRISHIHYHQRIYIPYLYFIKFFFHKITIIYTHHSIYDSFLNYFIICDKAIALNESTKKDLPFYIRKKSIIIPHGIKLKSNFPNKTQKPISVGYVGRFVKDKGIFNLIDAFKKVNIEVGQSRLILIGEGYLKDEIITYITNNNLLHKVKVMDPKIDEEEIYPNIDILVIPSEKLEGFGLVILEAMANYIPVITSNFSPFTELITDKLNGIISDNLHVDIITLLQDKTLFNTIQNEAIMLVRDKFDIKKIIREYINFVYI